jgi:hypothetical protein
VNSHYGDVTDKEYDERAKSQEKSMKEITRIPVREVPKRNITAVLP